MPQSYQGSIQFEWERGEQSDTLTIHYTLYPYIPATRWSPAEGGDCEFYGITGDCAIEFAKRLETDKQLRDQVDEACRDDAAERCERYEP